MHKATQRPEDPRTAGAATNDPWLDFAWDGFSLYTATLLVSLAGKALGWESSGWVLPFAWLAISIHGGFRARGRSTGILGTVRPGMVLATAMVACALAACLFCDTSYDGRWYHQEGVIRLAGGFDPWRDRLPETHLPDGIWQLQANGHRITSAPTWINHYPKASETTAAAIYALTGAMESGKLFTFLLAASAFSLVVGLFGLLSGGRRRVGILFGLALASSPVVVSQLWTYYNDGQLYLLMLATCGFLVAHAARGGRIWLVGAALSMWALSNVKFTGPVYAAILCLAAGAWAFARSGTRVGLRTSGILATAWAFGVVVVGWNPYVRNFLEDGHPFHPLMGENRIEIMGKNAGAGFETRNRMEKYLECTFARTSPEFHQVEGRIPPKIPFAASWGEFQAAANPDVRVAGFGPFHAGTLLVGLAFWGVGVLRRWKRRSGPMDLRRLTDSPASAVDLLVLICWVSALVNPQFWWARYAPQLWCVPLLCMLSWELARAKDRSSGFRVGATGLLAGLVVLGSAPVLAAAIADNAKRTLLVYRDFSRMSGMEQPIQVYFGQWTGDRLKYTDHRIPFVPKPVADSLSGEFGDTLFYGGIIRHDSPLLEARLRKPGLDRSELPGVLNAYFKSQFVRPLKNLLDFRDHP